MKRKQANNVRIIGGQLRGSKLPVVDQRGLRPTTDRVRETVFNWLMPYLSGANCLDLFAGTGVLGLECVSRGAGRLVAVESARAVSRALAESVDRLNVNEAGHDVAYEVAHIVERDAIEFLNGARQFDVFDIVFVDPPFQLNLQPQVCRLLEDNGWLSDGAFIYVEQDRNATQVVPENWVNHRQGRAGQSNFILYRREGPI